MLKDKVALVTGAAQGIGLAISKEFIAQGANVVLSDYNPAVISIAEKLSQDSVGTVKGLVLDVTKVDSIQAGLKQTLADFSHLDYAVNNAGGGVLKPFAALTEDDFDQTIGLDLKGTFLCMREEIKLFLKQGFGSIVNCGALGSIYNPGGMGAYNAAKNGIIGMTQAAAIDYADQKIRVNCVAPGLTRTDLTNGDFLANVLPTVPMKRAESAEEVAKVFVFVASEATFMTGQTVLSDGGVSVGLK